jgi:uncharacterized protein with FMN-binding domain
LRRVILAICATAAALVLLLSFKSHTQSAASAGSPAAALGTPSPGTPSAGPSASAVRPSAAPSAAPSTTPSAAPSASVGGAAKTVTGAAWPTIYGPVQVRITVRGGRITAVTALEYPVDTPRDEQINQYAIPQLNSETLAAGNARIDAVSGATYTSQGYIASLQNALDQATGS